MRMPRGMWTAGIVSCLVCLPAVTGVGDTATLAPQAERIPGATWERVEPEALGWSADALDGAIARARELGTDALLIIYDGVVIAELGDVSRRHNVRSIRKPLLGALLGIQTNAGRLSLDATLGALGIDDKEGLTPAEAAATVRDLLTSRSGVYLPAAWEHPSHALNRPERGAHVPGTHFYYDNWDFNALGTIYNRVSDGDLFEDFRERIARPLGMQDYRVEEGEYLLEEASDHPAYVFHMSARDLGRFGLLYLREGRWDGEQVVPREWVHESTRTHVPDATPYSGYGYLWRTYPAYGTHFAATGAGSQMVVVAPEARLVVVHLKEITADETGVPRELFWQLYGMIAAAAPR